MKPEILEVMAANVARVTGSSLEEARAALRIEMARMAVAMARARERAPRAGGTPDPEGGVMELAPIDPRPALEGDHDDDFEDEPALDGPECPLCRGWNCTADAPHLAWIKGTSQNRLVRARTR